MSIYTRGGDSGGTETLAGSRVRKDSPLLEANGTLDELVAHLGVVRAGLVGAQEVRLAGLLLQIQQDLFSLGAFVSSGDPAYLSRIRVTTGQMEQEVDLLFGKQALTSFVVPGETTLDAACHVARTVCRRAERCLVALDGQEGVSSVLPWVNRLSDLLFALAWHLAQPVPSPVSR